MISSPDKHCSRCSRDLPVSAFGRNRATRDGLHCWCRECVRAYERERYLARGDEVRAKWRRYRARNLEHVRQITRDSRERKRQRVLTGEAPYPRYSTPEYQRHAAKLRRARTRGALGAYSDGEWSLVMHIYGGRCAYCGDVATARDHIVPISRGGSNLIENLIPACKSCNSKKKDRTIAEWRPDLLENEDVRMRVEFLEAA